MTTPQDSQQSVNLEDVSSETGPVHRQNTNDRLDISIGIYVWTTFAGLLALRPPVSRWRVFTFFFFFPIALILLGITLCLQKYKRNWFMIDSGSKN